MPQADAKSTEEHNTFLLCVGCQKGGTSWLYDQLSKHSAFQPGFKKEYHVFDRIYGLRKPASVQAQNITADLPNSCYLPGAAAKLSDDEMVQGFRSDSDRYFDYFDGLLNLSQARYLTGDFTPMYAALPIDAFAKIKESFGSRNIQVKVIFLMRDPVERILSYTRMRRRRNLQGAAEITETEDVLQRYKVADVVSRTKYEDTIFKLDSVFAPEDVFYGIYENLFQPESAERLKKFLCLQELTLDSERRVNASQKTKFEFDEDAATVIAQFYRSTYKYCAERFDTKLWRGFE